MSFGSAFDWLFVIVSTGSFPFGFCYWDNQKGYSGDLVIGSSCIVGFSL